MIEKFIPHDQATYKLLSDNFINKTYGKLKIIEILGKRLRNNHCKSMVKVLCECGISKITALADVKNGHTKSCGCLRLINNRFIAVIKHGELTGVGKYRSTEYQAWCKIKRYLRLQNRDIQCCDRWIDPEKGYLNFIEDMGRKPGQNYRMKRVDMKKGFFPENCIWKTYIKRETIKVNN